MIPGILYEGGRFFIILAENNKDYVVAEWIMCDDDTHPSKVTLESANTCKMAKHDPRIERISDDIFELV